MSCLQVFRTKRLTPDLLFFIEYPALFNIIIITKISNTVEEFGLDHNLEFIRIYLYSTYITAFREFFVGERPSLSFFK